MILGRKLLFTSKTLHAVLIDKHMPYYAVRRGKCPGVYSTWAECKAQVENFPGARYKKFNTENEAKDFVHSFDTPKKGTYYARKYGESPATSPTMKYDTSSTSQTSVPENNTGQNKAISKATKLKVVEQEIECLKAKLRLKEAEKKVLETQKDLEELKKQCDVPGKTPTSRQKLHNIKPYQKCPSSSLSSPSSSSPVSASNSSNWSQNRVTRMLDLDSIRGLHTSTSQGLDSDNDSIAVVYTDGACVNNGTVLARAGIGVYWGPGHVLNVSERITGRQTNNRAEILAVVKAVLQAKQQGFKEITVKTDSQFLINSYTKWLPGWKRNGWKTSTGADVINKEDFEALERAAVGIHINWVHVRGHQGIAGNEEADKLAVAGANKEQRIAKNGR
ncbi:Ribonuclease H1 [Mactra antiquata]